jgi:ABC-2 type transport system permease protein
MNSKIKLARAMEFRADFILGVFSTFTFSCTIPLVQFLIYTRTSGYPDWSFAQILLFSAMLLFWSGITETAFGEIKYSIQDKVKTGSFDRLLVLPYPAIIMILTKGFNYRSFGTMLAGAIALVYSILNLGIVVQWWQILLFFCFLVIGLLFYISLLILYCTLCLAIVNMMRLKDIFDKLVSFSFYPAEIFGGVFKFFYLIIIPVAVWIYFPVQILLHRLDIYMLYAMLISILLLFLSLILWNLRIKKYTSAGG